MRYFCLFLISLLALVPIHAKEGLGGVMSVRDEAGEILSAVPLDKDVVIKFSNDSVFLSAGQFGKGFDIAEVHSFVPDSNVRSDLKVSLLTGRSLDWPVEGCVVTLRDEAHEEIFGVSQLSGEDGVASFPSVPTGFYSLNVIDPAGMFFQTQLDIVHYYDDAVSAEMHEIVLDPFDVGYSFSVNDNNLYDVRVDWRMDRDETPGESFRNYLFYIHLNRRLLGTTPDRTFLIEDVAPGNYKVYIYGISGFDNPVDYPYVLQLELPQIQSAGAGGLNGAEDSFIYFDLSGNRVASDRLAPGIYIRRSSSGKSEKIII